jgi:hypothetical protein
LLILVLPLIGRTGAVMRGAVMHGLGLNLVKERLMRRSYGVVTQPIFRPGVDPQDRRSVDVIGVARCRDVMDWYARKVQFSPSTQILISGYDDGKRKGGTEDLHCELSSMDLQKARATFPQFDFVCL